MKILIKGGRVISPAEELDEITDILIEDGKISKIQKSIKVDVDQEINAQDKLVVPGFVDMHTHLREPGEEDKETIESGAKAALFGGFTTVCAMPNTKPACDNQAQVKFIIEKAQQSAFANVLPIGAITKAREGKEITEMADLKEAGCIALSDDGDTVENSSLMRRALEYASMLDLLIISHCESKVLAGKGVMHEGYWSTFLGLQPIPAEAESLIVDRDIQLSELAGARLHIAHVSTAKSVDIIRQAKKRGVDVTAEVTPHHFSLTDESLKAFDSNLKVNPPLRSKEDVVAIKEGLRDGTIDVIATDHAPHLEVEKEREFDYAPFGMIGLETALSLSIMNLVDEEYLDWSELICKLSVNPCRILKYARGTFKPLAVADIVIIDTKQKWKYSKDIVKSLSINSPFLDWSLKGAVTDVFVAGRRLIADGSLVEE